MRPSVVAVALLFPVSAVQAQDGVAAQKLYEATQQKLTKAKAHKVEFAADAQFDDPVTMKGTLILAVGNRLHLTFEAKRLKRASKGLWVSDGKTLVIKEDRGGKPFDNAEPVPEKLFEDAAGLLVHGAAGLTLLRIADRLGPEKEGMALKASGFKLLGKEKVGDREALTIEYQLAIAGAKELVQCKVWLDPQTQLPLKRMVELHLAGKLEFRIVETYSRWELDPKLPDDTFTLPK
jgi:outer membrane lipoprotein-sorting protein